MTEVIISTAEEMNPTSRSTMEDCHIFHPAGSWGCNDSNLCYVGVYDGHGGMCVYIQWYNLFEF